MVCGGEEVGFISTWGAIRADARRYDDWRWAAGFWVSFSYRLRRLRKHGHPVWRFLLPLDVAVGIVRHTLADTRIPSVVPIGPGLYLPHPNGIIINSMANIGGNVSVFHQVTIGEWRGRAPAIGNDVAIFAGAKVFGGVTVGDGCMIGANAVVTRDLPQASVAAPAPVVIRAVATESSS